MTLASRAVILGMLAGLSGGCAYQENFSLRYSGAACSIEGLQPYSGDSMKRIAIFFGRKYNLCASSTTGQWNFHLNLANKVKEQGKPVIIWGYSSGCEETRKLAARLGDKAVDLMFLIDPTFNNHRFPNSLLEQKISKNVRKVVVLRNSDDYDDSLRGLPLDESDLEDPRAIRLVNYIVRGTSHLTIPTDAEMYSICDQEIRDALETRFLVERQQ